MRLYVGLPTAIKRKRRSLSVRGQPPLIPKEEMCACDVQEPVRSVLACHTRLSFCVQCI